MTPVIDVSGLPADVDAVERALFLTRIQHATHELLARSPRSGLDVRLTTLASDRSAKTNGGRSADTILAGFPTAAAPDPVTAEFLPCQPRHKWDRLVLPARVRDEILVAIETIRQETRLFDDWGLREIEASPRTALNFFGPPGTGKTLAAHGVADLLQRPLIAASYAAVESKYLGEGPKNAERLFHTAQQAGAVLFIDEADSLVSKRLVGASQGAERAANSLTSQFLICLEQFRGVVILATNMIENYDHAFDTRVRHIEFTLPDLPTRLEIWRKHLPARLPLADDVRIDELAAVDGVCGREIRNTVITAASQALRDNCSVVNQSQLLEALRRTLAARRANSPAASVSPDEAAHVTEELSRVFPKKGRHSDDHLGT